MSAADPTRTPSWARSLNRLAWTQPLVKAAGNAAFLVLFFYLYLEIQRQPLFEVTQIPGTALDRWIGFRPSALPLYLSLWVYTALPVALQPDLPRLVRYGLHMGVLCGLGLVVFMVWPTSVSAAVGVREGGGLFATLYAVDNNGNACPSLHVATAVFSCLWLRAILADVHAPRWLHATNWAWSVGISISTMAIKQHLLIDVVAGAALGAVVAFFSLRAACPIRGPVQ